MKVFGISLLIGVVVAVSFFIEALMVKWLAWALHDVGYLPHALNFNQSCTVAAPIFVASLIGALFASNK